MSNLVVFAVSGHRRIQPSQELTELIRQACDLLRKVYPQATFDITTCLAEGADRVLTIELGAALNASHSVVLPLPAEEYIHDFHSPASILEFNELVRSARHVSAPALSAKRPEAYAAANEKMLSGADGLFAIWDGEPSRGIGGTAAVVEHAREQALPIIWIKPIHQNQYQINFLNIPQTNPERRRT